MTRCEKYILIKKFMINVNGYILSLLSQRYDLYV